MARSRAGGRLGREVGSLVAWWLLVVVVSLLFLAAGAQAQVQEVPEDRTAIEAEAALEAAQKHKDAAEEVTRGRTVISVIGGFTVLCMLLLSLRCFLFVNHRRPGADRDLAFSTMFRQFLGFGGQEDDGDIERRFTPEELSMMTRAQQETSGTIWVFVKHPKNGHAHSRDAFVPVHWFRHLAGNDERQDPLVTYGGEPLGGGDAAEGLGCSSPPAGEGGQAPLAISVGIDQGGAGAGGEYQSVPGNEPSGHGSAEAVEGGAGAREGSVQGSVQVEGQEAEAAERRLSVASNGPEECCICLEETANVRVFPCKHKAACQLCFMRTLQSWAHTYPPNCPLCREAVRTVLLLNRAPDASAHSVQEGTQCVLPIPVAPASLSPTQSSDMRVRGEFVFEASEGTEQGSRATSLRRAERSNGVAL